jgi:adenosine deaminase
VIRAAPKVELHVHLEGSIHPALARRLAARHGVTLPDGGGDEPDAGFRFRDFRAFVDLYVAISSCLRDPADFEEVVVDVAARLAAQRVRRAEITFTPMTHVARGVDAGPMLAGLAEGRIRAREEHGVDVAWVFDIVRTLPEQGRPTLDLALRSRDQGVIGLGLAGPEGWPHALEPFVPVFGRARAEGLAALPHAGELAGAEAVRRAVEELGARRIGHGVRCLDDPSVVELLCERGIPLEVCPTSNVCLGVVPSLAAHPLPTLLARGLCVTLGSDDPALFGTSLDEEYERCAACFGWDVPTVVAVLEAGIECALVAEPVRRALREEQRQALAELGITGGETPPRSV